MSLQSDLLTAIQAVLIQYGVQAGADPSTLDDPLRAPLGPNGEWQPTWLAALANQAAIEFPGGLGTTEELGWDGRPAARNVAWPSHFLYGGCLDRTDLTPHQRETLLYADQQAYGHALNSAGGVLPSWQPFAVATRGPWTAMLNRQVYPDFDTLRRKTEEYFRHEVKIKG